MGAVERVGDLDREAEGLIDRNRAAGDAVGERLAVEKLHHQKIALAIATDVVERADVRMIEARDRARLALQSRAELRVRGELGGEDFHRDVAPEARVDGAIDLAHATRADRADDLVRTELCVRREHARGEA